MNRHLNRIFCGVYSAYSPHRSVAQPGRALRLGRRSRRFNPCHSDHLHHCWGVRRLATGGRRRTPRDKARPLQRLRKLDPSLYRPVALNGRSTTLPPWTGVVSKTTGSAIFKVWRNWQPRCIVTATTASETWRGSGRSSRHPSQVRGQLPLESARSAGW